MPLIRPELRAAAEYLGTLHGDERRRGLAQLRLLIPESPEDARPRFSYVDLGAVVMNGLEPPAVLYDG